jgi:AraC family transcriptional regulator of adaptative response / DNA-3-methyladenine glycosylase II
MASVAMAAGFGSIRRFNDTFLALYKRPPSQLRRRSVTTSSAAPLDRLHKTRKHRDKLNAAFPLRKAAPRDYQAEQIICENGLVLRLAYRPPFDWNALLAFFTPRAIPGVEEVRDGIYRRIVRVDEHVALIAVSHLPARKALQAEIACDHVPALPIIASRLRRIFDLDADTDAIAAHLSRDHTLAPTVRRQPGLRTPGGWDPFEIAVRAILGQQISVVAARGLAATLVALSTRPLSLGDGALTHAFPTAQQLATADLSAIGMPAARRAALISLARAAVADPKIFEAANTLEESIARLRSIPGIGEWTAQYIALRGLHHPDAFPASDIGILRNAEQIFGTPFSPAQLLAHSEQWRPWRGYAAQHLWSASHVGVAPHAMQSRAKQSRATKSSLPTSAVQTRLLATTSTIAATGDTP